jgi:prophage antirepressor-like protein
MVKDGEPWFVGKDVAEALGYANTMDALAKHVDEDDNNIANRDVMSGYGQTVKWSNIFSNTQLLEIKKLRD